MNYSFISHERLRGMSVMFHSGREKPIDPGSFSDAANKHATPRGCTLCRTSERRIGRSTASCRAGREHYACMHMSRHTLWMFTQTYAACTALRLQNCALQNCCEYHIGEGLVNSTCRLKSCVFCFMTRNYSSQKVALYSIWLGHVSVKTSCLIVIQHNSAGKTALLTRKGFKSRVHSISIEILMWKVCLCPREQRVECCTSMAG